MAGDQPAAGESKPYTVECSVDEASGTKACKVDMFTYRGYQRFSACQVCHGLTGDGSTIGPSLIERLKHISKERFVDVVTNGYSGQIGEMPSFNDPYNPNVMKYVDNIYAYLKARSDGVLPPGRPGKIR